MNYRRHASAVEKIYGKVKQRKIVTGNYLRPKYEWLSPMCPSLFMRNKLAPKMFIAFYRFCRLSQCSTPHSIWHASWSWLTRQQIISSDFLFAQKTIHLGFNSHPYIYVRMCRQLKMIGCEKEMITRLQVCENAPFLVALLLRHDKPMLLMSWVGTLHIEIIQCLLVDVLGQQKLMKHIFAK